MRGARLCPVVPRGIELRPRARCARPKSGTSVTPIISPELPQAVPPLRQRITSAYLRDETEALAELLEQARLPAAEQAKVQATAAGDTAPAWAT